MLILCLNDFGLLYINIFFFIPNIVIKQADLKKIPDFTCIKNNKIFE